MAKLQDLEKYINYEFSSGCYTGEDYKTFERKYINYLKSLCKNEGWELVNVGKNHYEFSVFFKYKEKFVYMRISDVRFFPNEWYNHILVRTAESEKDYHGGWNQYTSLTNIVDKIKNIFDKGY